MDLPSDGLAKAIRQVPQLQATRLVAVTGWGAKEDKDRTQDAGFDHHLTKPVSFDVLNALVSEIRASGGRAGSELEKA
jgi:CheY-like chemotaxis protein